MKQTDKTTKRRRLYFTSIVTKDGKTISKCKTHSIRIFMKNLRTINWKDGPINVYLKVDYGLLLDYYGKMSRFINEGDYSDPDNLWLAFNAFIEE